MADDIDLHIEDEGRPDLRDLVRLHILGEGEVWNNDGLQISTIRNEHPPLVDSFTLSSNTRRHMWYFPAIRPLSRVMSTV